MLKLVGNIQLSQCFALVTVDLYELKTYHEVIDEIYYKVQHLEPWEKGSRKTAGQTGMCGGVSFELFQCNFLIFWFFYVFICSTAFPMFIILEIVLSLSQI